MYLVILVTQIVQITISNFFFFNLVILVTLVFMYNWLGVAHLRFIFPLFPPVSRQMNDTWKQTDPTIKKKRSQLGKIQQ